MRISIVTISDRVSREGEVDPWGGEIESALRVGLADVELHRRAVGEEPQAIRTALEDSAAYDYVLTAGCNGIAQHEVAPEVTAAYCDRELPGIVQALRASAMQETPLAMLMRSVAGMKGDTIIVNLPGSVHGVRVATRVLLPIMRHTPAMIRGEYQK